MKDIMNNLKKSDKENIQLRIAVNIISSKDTDQERVVQSKSDKIEVMIYNIADQIFKINHFFIDSKLG